MLTTLKKSIPLLLLTSFYAIFSAPTIAASSAVVYPKIKNNGNSWYPPSTALASYYNDYFIDMDRSYKTQVINDKRFSDSLKNSCGEVSALLYRYLHNKAEKPLFNDVAIDSGASFQKKEGLPFIGSNSQYYQRDMYTEYPKPSSNGKYRGQFVYEYKIKAGDKSVFQLDKNLGGGDGKSKQIMFLAYMANYFVDENGNKQAASQKRLYVMLKIDKLKEIKQASSEKDAFQQGVNSCTWLSRRLN